MNPEEDPRYLPERCVRCGKPTTSHRIPNGYSCHSCWRDGGSKAILNEMDGLRLTSGSDFSVRLEGPMEAGGEFKLTASPDIAIVEDAFDWESYPHAVYVEHPSTTIPVELPASEGGVERVRDEFDTKTLDALP